MKRLLLLLLFYPLLLSAELPNQNNKFGLGLTKNIDTWAKKSPYKLKMKANTSITNAKEWLDGLYVNLELIAKYGYGAQKRLSELLGAYWMLYRYSDETTQKAIEKRLEPFFAYTKKPEYLNLHTANNKIFKKNSMSFLRIMWLFRELGFDITHLDTYFKTKIKQKTDKHLTRRGDWQKSMFARYYDFFGYQKPKVIADTSALKGLIGKRKDIKTYKMINSYALTHQVYVAYDYGAKKEQTRFNKSDMKYIKRTLLGLARFYRKKKKWDIHAEIMQCLIYTSEVKHKEFTLSMKALIEAQNGNGSWGDYEKYRDKFGNFVETKHYLHTTGVALSAVSEYAKGEWNK